MMPFPKNAENIAGLNYKLSPEFEALQKRLYSELEQSGSPGSTGGGESAERPAKLARSSAPGSMEMAPPFCFDESTEYLPSGDTMVSLLEIYFEIIHPWIPMIHERTLRHRFQLPGHRKAISNILHAMVVATARFSLNNQLAGVDVTPLVKTCRQRVMVTAMESISVENLQALIIIAFDSIGSGNGPRTWAVVDAMTRMVDHLRLSFEPDVKPLVNTGDPKAEWRKQEENRRIFWNVFFLDRFCSVSAGWNPTIDASKIKRRLPSDGFVFQDAGPANARYFQPDRDPVADGKIDYEAEEVACLGGLSYSVEATESLVQVADFYIQKEINAKDTEAVQSWLLKFRKMDMKLVNWKKSLPPIWRNRDKKFLDKFGQVIQDPNLSLAHVTHNASVILLHQQVAFPLGFSNSGFIPYSQNNSLKICVSAATEILNAAEDFMNYNPGVTNPQFSFCLFVSGRLLRAHNASRPEEPLTESFNRVVELLFKISDRWEGSRKSSNPTNLATKFARSLLQKSGTGGDIRKPAFGEQEGYNNEYQFVEPSSKTPAATTATNSHGSPMSTQSTNSADLFFHLLQSESFPPFFVQDSPTDLSTTPQSTTNGTTPSTYSNQHAVANAPTNGHRVNSDFVSEIESFLEDPQYMNLDRVWSFGDPQ
ncbi:hypothetical protein TRICI_003302 [Trichomonascus ciferrii]|uniref:Xylanolytic transcriptional activator regulatory domain-containing protein n=1 Tax=Trichomonascus ciferrii TaxID=44093 RepID=A0A642V3H3_9ASCO|nr:hypothetical protein TRICI_003302 [Trichomonascus ciferrii]